MYHPDVCRPIEPKPMRPRKGMSKGEEHAQERRPPVCLRPQKGEPAITLLGK